ncbi:MAG: exported protein of unknown function [Candidatus Thorarchaeota archaeon]|nr:MAG: exported protein of unknown function [Candidatus Thorarchaeota archaeon]
MRSIIPFFVILSITALLIAPVSAQYDTYPTVIVNYREIRMVPEDFSFLSMQAPPFSSEVTLSNLLSSNNTFFWEPLGNYNATFVQEPDVSTFTVVQVNNSGFFQTIVGLSSDNQTLKWVRHLDTTIASNFTVVVEEAIDFFADEDRYWGLCEEIVVLPGSLVNLDDEYIWRFKFHLVAESQRWTLLFDTSGSLLTYHATTIPCACCDNSLPVIILGGVILAVVIFGIYSLKYGAPGK